jgi:hypothetical protein
VSDVIEDPDNPAFWIWFPAAQPDGTDVKWTMDVSSAQFEALHDGTDEMCRALLARLRADVHEIRSWRVERICTPFLTSLTSSDDWRDRYVVSWRVTITARIGQAEPVTETGPFGVDTYDETAEDADVSPLASQETCEILAVEVAEPGAGSTLAERLDTRFPELPVTVRELTGLMPVVRVGRVGLGRRVVEDDLEELDRIKAACDDLGLATDIDSFHHRLATLL